MSSTNLLQELASARDFLTSLDFNNVAHQQEELDNVVERLREVCRACHSQRNTLAPIGRLPPETILLVFDGMEVQDILGGARLSYS